MTSGYPNAPSEEDLAYLQKLSNEFEPEITVSLPTAPEPPCTRRVGAQSSDLPIKGPLVGELQSSANITTEYASADPVYVKKTRALPQKYPNYRTCRGDGNCGWRAIGFAYFEALIRTGQPGKLQTEVARLKSFQNILGAAGFELHLYEDFADELYDLLRRIADLLSQRNDGNSTTDIHATLLAAFNDESAQASIITFLRILTSAWIKTHSEVFAPFLIDEDPFSYCSRMIEPFRQEIENLGISALSEVLLKPAGFDMEIQYLDRTPGDEMNTIHFGGEVSIATLTLLYRPGHYDILYKPGDVPPPFQASHSVSGTSVYMSSFDDLHNESTDGARRLDYLQMIPGMTIVDSMSPYSYGDSTTYSTPISTQPPPLQQPLSGQPVAAQPLPPPAYAPPPLQVPSQNLNMARLPMHPSPHSARSETGPFRHSAWELEPTSQGPPPQFTTSIFRNSHFNTAHFLNPDFEPEQWSPDAEYMTANNSNKRRHGH
ncbi:MAG: hypothetical protein M1820_006350 [Bogoriella megaspora]|nr:MAG: hypothetical protein M1820_006350 [Bogoriella megaspora]